MTCDIQKGQNENRFLEVYYSALRRNRTVPIPILAWKNDEQTVQFLTIKFHCTINFSFCKQNSCKFLQNFGTKPESHFPPQFLLQKTSGVGTKIENC